MPRNMQDYAATCAEFRWQVPETFNFAADVVERWAAEGDGPALVWEGTDGAVRRFAFSQIAEAATRCASALAARGIAKGDRVLVMTPRIPEWQIAMVACLRLGAVPVPCIEMLTARDLGYRLQHSGARGVICRAAHTAKFDGLLEGVPARLAIGGAPGFDDWEAALAAGDPAHPAATVGAEDPAVLYYTSGSTGMPKGVLHASRGLWAWRAAAEFWLDLGPGDVIWCTADIGWSKAGTSILFGPWAMGACAFFHDGPFDPAARLRLLARHGVTVYCAPGTELFRVAEQDFAAHDLSRLRHVVTAGETLSAAILEKWRARTPVPIFEGYGQTETLMTVNNYPCCEVRPGSMGLPLPGLEVAVIDAAGQPLPAGEEGDLALRLPAPQMMLGYLGEPERTAESIVEADGVRWFVTGDRAWRDDDGYVHFGGRRDDIISSAGYRIGPVEVENALLEHPAVLECAAVGKPDPERGEIVKAHVVLRDGVAPSEALVRELQDHVKALTAPYKYPREIAFQEALPKTLTGKIQRAALRALDRPGA